MSELPWFKFYPNDLMGDMNLRRCSNEAVGVLTKFMCLAFDSEERGVVITSGVPWTDREIVSAIGGPFDDTLRAFQELVRWNVVKVRKDGAYYNARMVKDDQERKKSNERVKKHRSKDRDGPADIQNHHVTGSVTVNVTPNVTEHETKMKRVEVRGQKSEVRSQISDVVVEDAHARRPATTATTNFSNSNPRGYQEENPPPNSAAPPPYKVVPEDVRPWRDHPSKEISNLECAEKYMQDRITNEVVVITWKIRNLPAWLEVFNKVRSSRGEHTSVYSEYAKGFSFWISKQSNPSDPNPDIKKIMSNVKHSEKTRDPIERARSKFSDIDDIQRRLSDNG